MSRNQNINKLDQLNLESWFYTHDLLDIDNLIGLIFMVFKQNTGRVLAPYTLDQVNGYGGATLKNKIKYYQNIVRLKYVNTNIYQNERTGETVSAG